MEIGMEQAGAVLRSGRALIFPTDTVWGIGVAVECCEGPQVLAEAKRRDAEKPVAWLVGSKDALLCYGRDVPEFAFALAEAFWPGPLTIVVRAGGAVPASFAAKAGTVGLRMPDSACALALIDAAGSPVATTSANFAGEPASPACGDVDRGFAEACGAPVLRLPERPGNAGACVASAVVDCTGGAPRLLRAGTISASEMHAACGIRVEAIPQPRT